MSTDVALDEFHALRVKAEGETILRHIFFRRHNLGSGAAEDRQSTRAVFLTGLSDQHAQEETLQLLLGQFDELQSLVVHPSQLSAVVLFKTNQGFERLSKASEQSLCVMALSDNAEPKGIKKWMLSHKAKVPGNSELQKQLDGWIGNFEEQEKASKAKAAAGENDGWTVVTRKPGRRKTGDKEGSIAVGGISRAIAETKQKPAEFTRFVMQMKLLENFYRHQKWQKQKSDLWSLKAKFAEDKRKVAALKAARRFRPN